jgi:EF-P beta-lysylation protein EpmB
MPILTAQFDPVRAVSGTWQQQMKWAIRDTQALCQILELPENIDIGAAATKQFPVFVPLPFLQRIQRKNIDDPLLRQVLPISAEDNTLVGFSTDPLEESSATLTPGLLQKYKSRVLMVTTGACAIHCRYCFRRNFPYSESPGSMEQWLPAIEKIKAADEVNEVILSGGDPLTLVDDRLISLIDAIEAIPHIKRIRFHTRLPIMIPQRITDGLLDRLRRYRGQVIFVIHSNHANEIDDAVASSLLKLKSAGVTLLNQSVLLRGVNNDIDSLVNLSERLIDCGVLPYYLHQLDRVTGVAHFEVPRERGLELISQMRSRLPGYAVPRYVKEEPGEPSKTVWA